MAKKTQRRKRSKKAAAKHIHLGAPELFINRELSWLEFNDRVLREGLSDDLPLLERLKFLSIVSSNLDEFFMIRVAGLRQQVQAGKEVRDVSGLTAAEQLERISERVHKMVDEQTAGIHAVLRKLPEHGIHVLEMADLSEEQETFLESYFHDEVSTLLTPLGVDRLEPFPLLPSGGLNLALRLSGPQGQEAEEKIAIVPVPRVLPRFVVIPAERGLCLVRLEDVVAEHVHVLFRGYEVKASAVFRITRDADVAIDDDDVSDLLHVVEETVHERGRRGVVRLEISSHVSTELKQWLVAWCEVDERDVYEIDGMLDATALMDIAFRPGFEELKVPEWPPQTPRDLLDDEDLWQTLQAKDVLLFHPYESFDPVVRLLELAAQDPDVLAIKQTLYRTSSDSPIIRALARAADNGKEVTVLVELKARFDEARNVNWARNLEDAGCHVIYGIAGLKTHAKLLLVIRRESHGIRRYVHVATGNYNDRTAKLYSDIGLMTCEHDFASDASAFFNLLTGYSQEVGWSKFTISPTGLRQRFLELIEREIGLSTPDQPGLIMAKTNSLQDKGICQALYRASRAGVRVMLNVRGICCLRPGLKGVSDHIEVVSIVDRFLEHARIFYFGNGGHEEVYMSSADWMERNIDRRLEIMFPVLESDLRQRLIGILETLFADNVKAWRLQPNGQYKRAKRSGAPVRAQEQFYREAFELAHAPGQAPMQFRPMTRPEE